MRAKSEESGELLLLGSKLVVVNVGLQLFADSVEVQGAQAVRVDWRPPRKRADDIELLLQKVL